ncbi:uncharacterized protein LOC114846266 [Betta splendens]|uniref:Uncharacterized protein LOC114846266 n=1 Tax=Betta splendens TaxID=158456 RepID=A0A9W2XFY3_BETSP|nr:uncharacterized protein LOC114846266 [Betta splendens]
MSGGKQLLLLAVLLLLERCQQKPQVMMSPNVEQVFSGDLFYLKCNDSKSVTPATWYQNDARILMTTHYKIAVAQQSHSGQYECEINGEKSDKYQVTVLDFEPSASLTIKTGQPVMQTGASVTLSLQHQDGIQGWQCYVQRGDEVKRIKLRNTSETSLDFQPRRLEVPETTFWCHHSGKKLRSNQITVRTSDKQVSLEMYPLLPVAGQSLTLRCLTWGTDLISHARFYKDNTTFLGESKGIYNIPKVAATDVGSYRCHASFTYIKNPTGPPYELDSDPQDLRVQEQPMQAVLSEDIHCSCERCQDDAHSHWYKKSGESWVEVESSTSSDMTPDSSGTYACRRAWGTGRSALSNAVHYQSPPPSIPVTVPLLILLLLIALVAAVGIFIWRKRRSATGAIYEDVALRSHDKSGEKGDNEYDTLDPEAPNRKRGEKEGQYEPLKKEETKEGEYQTLGMERAAGGEGGYQALKKGGEKEGVYHTLGAEGATGGEGGYQALKKGGEKEGVYHTLGAEGATGGEGGYQALKKGGEKEGVYHTLGAEGATGGEGGYQALKKGGEKEGVYHTLGGEGAAGGQGAAGKDNKDKEYEIVDEKKAE